MCKSVKFVGEPLLIGVPLFSTRNRPRFIYLLRKYEVNYGSSSILKSWKCGGQVKIIGSKSSDETQSLAMCIWVL